MMKRYIVTVIIIAFTGVSFAKDVFKVGYFDNKPHISLEAKKTVGALAEYLEKEIVPAMDCDIEWVGPIPPARLFAMLESGEINAIALLGKNSEREKLYAYPDVPFLKTSAGIAVLKDAGLTSVTLQNSLSGKTITFFKGGLIAESLKSISITWDFIGATTWKTQGLEKLLVKRTDGVYDAEIYALTYEVNLNPNFKSSITVLPLPQAEVNLYTVFSRVDDNKFVTLYNNAVKKVPVEYTKILESKIGK